MKGHAVVHAIEPGAAAHAPATVSGLTLARAGLIAAATVAGAWLAFRRPGHREIWFAAAAGALLIIAGGHLLPDAWAGARAARIWPPLVPIAAIGAFTAAGLAARAGCGCQEHTEHASGAGAAAALAVHRFLEGSAVVLAGPAVAVALAVHAFAEGLATGALLALAAGILTQAARISLRAAFHGLRTSLRAAFHGLRTSPLPLTHTAAVTTTAAIITVLAVHTAG